MDDVLKDFLAESHESLALIDAGLIEFERDPANTNLLNNVFRLVHTMKGTCGFLNLSRLESLSHAAESLIYSFRLGATVTPDALSLILKTVENIKELLNGIEAQGGLEPTGDDSLFIAELEQMADFGAGAANTSGVPVSQTMMSQSDLDHMFEGASETAITDDPASRPLLPDSPSAVASGVTPGSASRQQLHVKVALLEQLVLDVTDLIATRAQLLEIARRSDDYELKTTVNHLAEIASRLQKVVVETRVQPIGSAWQQMHPMIDDLAIRLEKNIELVLDGDAIEVDRQIVDLIKAPLAHMVRNCADHGVETPDKRLAAGKLAQGTIGLTAVREGSDIVIEVLDDGQGLDVQKIKQKALDSGLISDDAFATIDDMQAAQLIFEPGLSTRENVTRLSGRGFGLDVARNSIEKTGGSIKVYTVQGEGTVFVIRIPVTPAQFSSLILSRAKDYEKIVVNKPKTGIPQPANPSSSQSVADVGQIEHHIALPGPDTKILFLEECPFFRSMLIPILEAGGYNVVSAESVADVVERLEEDTRYLAIVCDLDMPDKVSLRFAEMAKHNENWTTIPLVAVSSLVTPLSRSRALEAGFDHCIAKFDRKGLLSCLNKITYQLKVAA